MKPMSTKTDPELEYAAEDCCEAARAYPQGHKSIEYTQIARACQKELQRRARLREWRKALKHHICDPLTYPVAVWSVFGPGVLIEGEDYVRVTFPEKPDYLIIKALKAAEFRWSGGSWLGYRSKLPQEVMETVEDKS